MSDTVIVPKEDFDLNAVLSALFKRGSSPFIDSGHTSRSYTSFCWFELGDDERLLHGVEVFQNVIPDSSTLTLQAPKRSGVLDGRHILLSLLGIRRLDVGEDG